VTINEMVEDLCEVESGLTDWEVQFVEGMARLDECFMSPSQVEKVKELHEYHCR